MYLTFSLSLSLTLIHTHTHTHTHMHTKLTDGYSGSDIRLVCKEAAMKSVRLVFDQLESLSSLQSPSSSEPNASSQQIKIQPVRTTAVKEAISSTKPSAKTLANRYLDWQKEYASV